MLTHAKTRRTGSTFILQILLIFALVAILVSAAVFVLSQPAKPAPAVALPKFYTPEALPSVWPSEGRLIIPNPAGGTVQATWEPYWPLSFNFSYNPCKEELERWPDGAQTRSSLTQGPIMKNSPCLPEDFISFLEKFLGQEGMEFLQSVIDVLKAKYGG